MPKNKFTRGPRGVVCPKCQTDDWTHYRWRGQWKGWRCHECRRLRCVAWYAKNRDHEIAYHRERYRTNPGPYKALQMRLHALHPERPLFYRAKRRAKETGVPFALEMADILIPETCPVLGIPILSGVGHGYRNGNGPSLDRMNPALGYVPGNVCVISERANRIKNDGTVAEHRAIADWMEREGA